MGKMSRTSEARLGMFTAKRECPDTLQESPYVIYKHVGQYPLVDCKWPGQPLTHEAELYLPH